MTTHRNHPPSTGLTGRNGPGGAWQPGRLLIVAEIEGAVVHWVGGSELARLGLGRRQLVGGSLAALLGESLAEEVVHLASTGGGRVGAMVGCGAEGSPLHISAVRMGPWLVLECAPSSALPGRVVGPIADPLARPGVVLVVDRDRLNRFVACETLREAGYYVLSADSGESALALVQSLGEEEIDLAVAELDTDGVRGPELLARLREAFPRLRGLLTSRRAEGADASDHSVGFGWPVLEKPFLPDDLERRVRALML